MLHLHHADSLEPLLDALADVLAPAPADPFTADVVAVPAAGLKDAAMVGLGRRLGVSAEGAGDGIGANVEFMFPGKFMARALGDASRADEPESDPWRLPRLTWAVLEELAVSKVVVPGREHAQPWALARRIADLFDRYATQRPRLIECWANGEFSDGTFRDDGSPAMLAPAHLWQAQLWCAVRHRIDAPSPPERLPGLLHAIRSGAVQPNLPQRVSVFGVGSLAPTMQQVLLALSAQRDVHVFLRVPSMEAWRKSPHRLAGGLNVRSNLDVTIAASNALLASWGRPALEARALLHQLPGITEVPCEGPVTIPLTTLLAALQHGIRHDLSPASVGLPADDGSIQLHACHGEVRQLEVLRDALGHAFVADPTLQPHEVLVLCPDLERFAPLVEAVFARGALPVPVRVGDRSLTTDEPIIDAVQSVLSLVSGRATLTEVLSLVQYAPVRRRFGWNIEEVEQIAEWAAALGARWGLTAEHRAAWGLPGNIATGTWRSTVDQLLAGMAIAAPTPHMVLGEVAPFDDLSTNDFELVGSLADLLVRLLDVHIAVQGERPVADWISMLHGLVDEFCALDPDEPWRRQGVHRELTDILRGARSITDPDATCAVPLSLADVRALLSDALSERPGRLPLRSGSVTVSSMVPQHGVPARVICLLGLDDGALRGGTFDGDDVLGLRPCLGERHPRHESRQLLLDAVLGAGERLIITCNGADLTTNKETPFIVPVVELLGVLGALAPLDRKSAPLVVRHPRHGFNERALQLGVLQPGNPQPFTFDPDMLAAAEARRLAQADVPEFTVSPWALASVPLGTLDLDRLAEVVGNPAKVYLQGRLDMRVPDELEALDDGLSVDVEPLGLSGLGRDLLSVRRKGGMPEDWKDAARLNGALPPGELSTAVLSQVADQVGLLEGLSMQWGLPLTASDDLLIDQEIVAVIGSQRAEVPIVGKINGIANGPLGRTITDIRFSRPKPSLQLALAMRVAAAQFQDSDTDYVGVLLTRAESRGGALATGMRVRRDGLARDLHAQRFLAMCVQLFEWATRDAVPLFDKASYALFQGNIGKAFNVLPEDLKNRHMALLWSEYSAEAMLYDPALDTDPPFVQATDLRSRVGTLATYVWGTFKEHIELIDQHGAPLELVADEAGDDE